MTMQFRKVVAILLVAVLCTELFGCGSEQVPDTSIEEPVENRQPADDLESVSGNELSLTIQKTSSSEAAFDKDSRHDAYLPLENGYFFPDRCVTFEEAANAIVKCMNQDYKLNGEPVSEMDPIDAMYQLGGFTNKPDKEATLTRIQFYTLMENFTGHKNAVIKFNDLKPWNPAYAVFQTAVANGWIEDGVGASASPNEMVLRRDLARALNSLASRTADKSADRTLIGTIMDVNRNDPDYWDIVEASIDHECTSGKTGEHWINSKAPSLLEPGFYFVDGILHAADANGNAVIGDEYLGILFNDKGEQTSGDEELDELVRQVMAEHVDPENMTREEMLRALYDYCGNKYSTFSYRGRGHYERGATGWENEAAKIMLSTQKGNCYNFAAMFYSFARAIGYNAVAFSGVIYNGEPKPEDNGMWSRFRDHGWVEIEVDGEMHIFDAEMAFSTHQLNKFYNASDELREAYGYRINTT